MSTNSREAHGLAGALWQPDGTRLICRFKPEHLDTLPEAWLKTVTVRGKIAIEKGSRTGTIDVLALSVGEDHGGMLEVAPSGPEFWRSAPLDELIAGQAVAPVADLGELDAIWSEGDVFDDALSELMEDRAQRRRVPKTRAGCTSAAAVAAASLTAAARGALPEGRSGRRDGRVRSNKGSCY